MAHKPKGRRVTSASAPSPQHRRDATAIVADHDDCGPGDGHPPWPPPEEGEPRYDSARLAEESAEYGSLEVALAFARLERRLAEGGDPG